MDRAYAMTEDVVSYISDWRFPRTTDRRSEERTYSDERRSIVYLCDREGGRQAEDRQRQRVFFLSVQLAHGRSPDRYKVAADDGRDGGR